MDKKNCWNFINRRNSSPYYIRFLQASQFSFPALACMELVSFIGSSKKQRDWYTKAAGASVQSIIYLFSKEFIVLIIIGFLVAAR